MLLPDRVATSSKARKFLKHVRGVSAMAKPNPILRTCTVSTKGSEVGFAGLETVGVRTRRSYGLEFGVQF